MKQQICYASLAVYSKQDMVQEIGEALRQEPSRTGQRNGTYSWIYSTQDAASCSTVEQHVSLLKATLDPSTQALIRLSKNGCEIRAWIYFGLIDTNQAFVMSAEFITWLASFGADICVDAWSN